MSVKLRIFLMLAVALGLAIAWAVSFAGRDVTPPEVYFEAPERVPAGVPFEVSLSSNEPVSYEVRYGDVSLSEVAQRYTLSLLGSSGARVFEVSATDGADNQSKYHQVIYGIPQIEPDLKTSRSLIPGEPLSASLAWQDYGVEPQSINMRIAGEEKPIFIAQGEAAILTSIPLGEEAKDLNIEAVLTDEYGRVSSIEKTLKILKDPRQIEELNLNPASLQMVTPEARATERQAMDAAYARKSERPLPQWSEAFVLPLQGRESSAFGLPRRYVRGGNVTYHYGADIAAPAGSPIVATNTGRVLIADFYPIKGGLVVIDHGASVYSLYFHQSKLHVEVDDIVQVGQVIGEVGSTGLSTGPHLHWEIRIDGVATNPLSWVGKVLP